MKQSIALESARRWHVLLNRKRAARIPAVQGNRNAVVSGSGVDDDVDPFDCSSVAIPTSQGLVDSTLQQFVHQWKQLDARKVIIDEDEYKDDDVESDGINNETARDYSRKRRRRAQKTDRERNSLGWLAHRLKIPENFDYASRRAEPPLDTESSAKVISLVNPSLHVSYEQELWKLFQTVPTLQEIEDDAVEGHQLHHTFRLHDEMTQALRENGRLDGHALSRMRMNDRHGLPVPTALVQSQYKSEHHKQHLHMVSTVRLEIWRRQQQPKRGPSPDPHRMVLEFLGEQSLLDVHLAIIELSEDDLWDDNNNEAANKATASNKDNDNGANTDNSSDDNYTQDKCSETSGAFFIEGIFFTCGTVDYAEPIRSWIDDDKRKVKNRSRREFLGITAADHASLLSSSSLLAVQSMSRTRLDSIPWRLGFRYYHAHHGDVESALFASDLRVGPTYSNMTYPIIHDIWCPSSPMTECEACQHRPAVLVTPPSCKITDGGPRAICDACNHHLKKNCDQQEELKVTRYSTWRDQPDLSLAASREVFF